MSTNFATASYEEIYDIGTQDGKVSIFGIHTPTGIKPRFMLHGFFDQFREFKYLGISKFIVKPSGNYLIDPLNVSTSDENAIDPRDLQNPICFKGVHGDNLNGILNQIYKDSGFNKTGDSIDEELNSFGAVWSSPTLMESMYYAMLSDTSFRKYNAQTGLIKKGLYPLVHKAALIKQMLPAIDGTGGHGQLLQNAPVVNSSGQTIGYVRQKDSVINRTNGFVLDEFGDNDSVVSAISRNQLFTNGKQKLGWMSTRQWFSYDGQGVPTPSTEAERHEAVNTTATYLPKLFMGLMILPPSYKQQLFYRVIIRHNFAFRNFTTSMAGHTLLDFVKFTPGQSRSQDYHDIAPDSLANYYNWLPVDSSIDDSPTLESVNGSVELTASGVN